MKSKVFVNFFSLLLFTSFLNAQDIISSESNKTLYFSEYVTAVYEKLPDIQLNKVKQIQSEVNQLKAAKQRNWNFELRSALFQESDFTGNIDSPFLFSRGWEIATSLQKSFVNIGGRMNLDFVYRQFTAEGIVDGITESRDFFVPTLTLQYAQPLLKNVFGLLDRLPIQMADIESKMTDWSVEEENAYLLANYKKLYMQWVVYVQIYDFLIETLENAKQLERLTQEQRRVGYIDEVDFQNSKMLVLEVENQLLDVQNTYTNLLYQIATVVEDTNIKPDIQEWDILQDAIENDSFTARDFYNTRQSLILQFMNDKLRHTSKAVRNSLLPELNAIVSVAMEVYATNSTPNIGENAIVPAYYTGLQLKYPLGDMEYQANLADLRKNRMEYNFLLKKVQQEYELKMNQKNRNMTFYRDKIINRQDMRNALTKRYNSQYKIFSQGRGILAQLIDTKNEMLRNRIEEADVQLRLIFEYFDYKVMNNEDELSRGLFE